MVCDSKDKKQKRACREEPLIEGCNNMQPDGWNMHNKVNKITLNGDKVVNYLLILTNIGEKTLTFLV